jgi:flavin reductase (DIM6/NTAB) family NADH-FMN oxidoreductase RutF
MNQEPMNQEPMNQAPMNQALKTQVLRKMTYGMWVLAADANGEREASAVTWVMQVSFQPPLIMVAVRTTSRLYQIVDRSRAFSLHLLSADQKALAESFTRPTEQTATTLGGQAFHQGEATGAPILDGFSCWLEARVLESSDRGDHTVFTAEVVNVGADDANAAPLVLSNVGWHYGG